MRWLKIRTELCSQPVMFPTVSYEISDKSRMMTLAATRDCALKFSSVPAVALDLNLDRKSLQFIGFVVCAELPTQTVWESHIYPVDHSKRPEREIV